MEEILPGMYKTLVNNKLPTSTGDRRISSTRTPYSIDPNQSPEGDTMFIG